MSNTSQTNLQRRVSHIARFSSLLYILFHLVDIVATYLLSPDLSLEANVMIARYGFGWKYVFLSAALTSLAMLIAQSWLWKQLVQRFPDDRKAYMDFYQQLLFDTPLSAGRNPEMHFRGILLAVLLVTLYSLIAAKIFSTAWNLLLLTTSITIESFELFLMTKNFIAGLFGLFMFFVFLYFIHHTET